MNPLADPSSDDVAAAAELAGAAARLKAELAKVIVGQHRVIEELLIALFAGGHCLMQGAPGLAKTRLISTLASALDLRFSRLQFTPDLMPSDITGTEVLQEDPETGRRRFEFLPGPVFANVLLADELNRTPPKTQAALLQAMQEREVSVAGKNLPLPRLFFVLATQNPIEQEGTYPLPEAQLDRFMFLVLVNYPTRDEEIEIYQRTTIDHEPAIERVMSGADLQRLQAVVRRVPIGEPAFRFAADVVRATRPNEPGSSDFVRHWLSWGAGPRAGQTMVLAAKARALMEGRLHVTTSDLAAVAPAALRHRVVPNFNAQAEGVSVEQIIQKILTLVPSGRGEKRL